MSIGAREFFRQREDGCFLFARELPDFAGTPAFQPRTEMKRDGQSMTLTKRY